MNLSLEPRKRIGLVAHDHKKQDLLEWALYNAPLLARHDLVATGTTGSLLERELGLPVRQLQSGPLGGDLQIGALIASGEIDFLVFFWDPLEPQPHDPDVRALLRVAVVWNIPVACDRATADFMISSPLMTGTYERILPDYGGHLARSIPLPHPGRAGRQPDLPTPDGRWPNEPFDGEALDVGTEDNRSAQRDEETARVR